MSRRVCHLLIIALSAAALGACGTVPDRAVSAGKHDAVAVRVDGALPLLQQHGSLESRANLSVRSDWLAWEAQYAFEPGEILSAGHGDGPIKPLAPPPKHVGGQRLGHNIKLQLPVVAGAPVSLAFKSELKNHLTVDGISVASHRGANLNWSPGPAEFSLQWTGNGSAWENSAALNCDVRGTLSLPVEKSKGHKRGMTLSGSRCTVTAAGTVYQGLEANTWGIGYAWKAPNRESRASLSMIRPEPGFDLGEAQLLTGYEVGVSHRRDYGPVSAQARIAMRQRQYRGAPELIDMTADVNDPQWVTNTSLQWKLARASVTANWMQGANQLWFAPEFGSRRDSFGLAVDLSKMLGRLHARAPELALNWNWSEVQKAGNVSVGGNALKFQVGLLF